MSTISFLTSALRLIALWYEQYIDLDVEEAVEGCEIMHEIWFFLAVVDPDRRTDGLKQVKRSGGRNRWLNLHKVVAVYRGHHETEHPRGNDFDRLADLVELIDGRLGPRRGNSPFRRCSITPERHRQQGLLTVLVDLMLG